MRKSGRARPEPALVVKLEWRKKMLESSKVWEVRLLEVEVAGTG